jgi:hypothetical protein
MPVAILTVFHAMGRGDTDDRFIVVLREVRNRTTVPYTAS